MEIPNLNCKGCEYQTELWREHCAECLFNLENQVREELSKQLTKDNVDSDYCNGCQYKFNSKECKDCIGKK